MPCIDDWGDIGHFAETDELNPLRHCLLCVELNLRLLVLGARVGDETSRIVLSSE